MDFADALIAGTRALGPLCVGIDPHAGRIPEFFGGDTPEGIAAWGQAVIACASGRASVIKPQAGLFERHGPAGMEALQAVTKSARNAGFVVIMDAKRGDIGSTAEGYATAYLGPDAPYPAHCLTINPYMGLDTLAPFVRRAEETGSGVAVLARTSNRGAADFESLQIDGVPLFLRIAEALKPMCDHLQGAAVWSNLMVVAGASGPEDAQALRRVLPRALFLVPGYGSQGAGASEAVAGFATCADGSLEGGVVNASRSITFPTDAQAATTRADWDAAIIAAMGVAQAELRAVTRPV